MISQIDFLLCTKTACHWPTSQALELLYSEMRRPDLTPSMRSGLLKATGALLSEPGVVAFWEESALLSQSAGLPDEQVCALLAALELAG